jgi:hypothetical protein
MSGVATAVEKESIERASLRARCAGCLASIRRIGEIVSTVCFRLWRALRALDALDDDLERQEIDEAIQAERLFVRAVQLAIADGRITGAERARLQVCALAMDRELADVRAYNVREDQQHQEALGSVLAARRGLAEASRGLDHAEAQAGTRNGGCERPWWDVELTTTTG